MADLKYITFNLAGQTYGVVISEVLEIIALGDITPIPQTAEFLQGLINLRGKVIPVIDLRLKLGFAKAAYTQESCVILCQPGYENKTKEIGMIVDTVCDVIKVAENQIEKTPPLGINIRTDFIQGIATINNEVIVLLYISKVLTSEELVLVDNVSLK